MRNDKGSNNGNETMKIEVSEINWVKNEQKRLEHPNLIGSWKWRKKKEEKNLGRGEARAERQSA